ncbi:MAG: 16S rRNA (guanine(966)-N(2))-methyltransferase RsmD [Betaproteobacteria bacterium]
MRIIGGQWRRSRLPVVDTPGLRPTPDRVRETLFNWLGQDLSGWRCLDAYAGSGALGFEAASRGAPRVLLVERDRRLAEGLRQVKARLHADAVEVICAPAQAVLAAQGAASFDLIFLDPPYGQGLLGPALAAAARVVVPGGWVYVEDEQPLSDLPAPWVLHRQGRAGLVHHHLLRRVSDPAAAEPSPGLG